MKGQYTIKILPKDAIDDWAWNPKRKGKISYVIRENTFSIQSSELWIRSKAGRYCKMFRNTPVYGVLYEDENNSLSCVFVFVFRKHSDGSEFIEITRGQGKSKEKLEFVKNYLNNNKDEIKNLSEEQELSFS